MILEENRRFSSIPDPAPRDPSMEYMPVYNEIFARVIKGTSRTKECIGELRGSLYDLPTREPSLVMHHVAMRSRSIALRKCLEHPYTVPSKNFKEMLRELSECSAANIDGLDDGELSAIISDEIADLDALSRTLFLRRYVYFEGYQSLADRFGMSVRGVHRKLGRARRELLSGLRSSVGKSGKNISAKAKRMLCIFDAISRSLLVEGYSVDNEKKLMIVRHQEESERKFHYREERASVGGALVLLGIVAAFALLVYIGINLLF